VKLAVALRVPLKSHARSLSHGIVVADSQPPLHERRPTRTGGRSPDLGYVNIRGRFSGRAAAGPWRATAPPWQHTSSNPLRP